MVSSCFPTHFIQVYVTNLGERSDPLAVIRLRLLSILEAPSSCQSDLYVVSRDLDGTVVDFAEGIHFCCSSHVVIACVWGMVERDVASI